MPRACRARCRAQQRAERAFVLSVLAQDFFKNIDDEGSALGIWYKGIKKNMQRLIAQRIAREAGSFSEAAPDLYLNHVRDMCAALAKASQVPQAEAAERKHSLKVLWRASGRASEPADLSYTTLKWNTHFDCAACESPQSKPSKMKWAPRLPRLHACHACTRVYLAHYLHTHTCACLMAHIPFPLTL